jgi:hypothetical protein
MLAVVTDGARLREPGDDPRRPPSRRQADFPARSVTPPKPPKSSKAFISQHYLLRAPPTLVVNADVDAEGCQLLSDASGRRVQVVRHPQEAAAAGSRWPNPMPVSRSHAASRRGLADRARGR